MENILTVKFTNQGMSYNLKEPAQLGQLLQVASTLIGTFAEDLIAQAQKDNEDISPELFDMLNHSFANILQNISPERAGYPHLTEVAILLAENTLLNQAEARGLTLEEYLPEAKLIQERELELFKRNQEGKIRHNQKIKKQSKEKEAKNEPINIASRRAKTKSK